MIKLPSIFSNGMVINKEARIWGWAKPETQITITFQGKSYNTSSAQDGRFEATLISPEYGGPYEFKIDKNVIQDVYVGHVWLCGGQSNMEQPLSRTRPLLDKHIKDNPYIRAFQAEKGLRFDGPACDVKGHWQTATDEALNEIFAVPYFFAQALNLGQIPIGLINIAAGGTPAEAWLPEEIIRTYPDLYKKLEPYKQPGFVETQEKAEAARVQEWHKNLHDNDTGLSEGWHLPSYIHDHWEEKMLLEKSTPKHGAVWYRKDIILPAEAITGPINLSLGRVVDSVKVYVNGEPVTSVDYQYPPCRCTIPEGLLKFVRNTIAIRVVGSSNSLHFTPGKRYELTHKNGGISLLGPWKRRVGCSMPQLKPATWLYNIPTCTYNYMLAPVLGHSIHGVIWYQGESNTGAPQGYKALFAAFVSLLRKHFGEDLPVIFTQLANFVDPHSSGENWAELRHQQSQCLEIPKTAMAVTIDCGEWNDLHPQDKKTVGERLALSARRLAYGEDIAYSGPVAKEAVINNGELKISFNHGEGLWAKNARPMVEVITANETTHHFYAKIEDDTLIAQVGDIHATHVRFAWTDCPAVVLYNAHGLPASPFKLAIG